MNEWITPEGRDRIALRWHALPPAARSAIFAAVVVLAGFAWIAACIIGGNVAYHLFGDWGAFATIAVGVAGLVGGIVGLIAWEEKRDAAERDLRHEQALRRIRGDR